MVRGSSKEKMMALFGELPSDRELARVLGVSQPTMSRLKRKLMREGIIRGYTVMPNFSRLGY